LLLGGGGSGEGTNESSGGGGSFAQLAGIATSLFASNADGGIETSPTISKLAEKGPEAIIPLKGGNVPVEIKDTARPAPVVNNVFNITTPDPAGFRRAQERIGAEVGQSLQRSLQRNA
jgi:hypothetical protein